MLKLKYSHRDYIEANEYNDVYNIVGSDKLLYVCYYYNRINHITLDNFEGYEKVLFTLDN